MKNILQFLFGLIQGFLPDILTTIDKSLKNNQKTKWLSKLLDIDKDGDFDIDDYTIITQGKNVSWIIWALGIGYFIYQIYMTFFV